MPYTIITHDGKAHLDELIGAALVAVHLGEDPESIERLDSREAESLVNGDSIPENTWFIDCGMVHDPKRKLYDHHQDRESDSAALLIFKELFSGLDGTEMHDFIELVSRVDTRGPMSLNDFEVMGESREYLYFGHNLLLRSFQKEPLPILRMVAENLKDRMEFEEAKKEAASWLAVPGNLEVCEVKGLKVLYYLQKPPSEIVQPLRSVINDLVEEHDASAILSFDDKQPGVRTFYRTDPGHDRIDFSRSAPAEKLFCHPGGFLMKFTPADEAEWHKLFTEAVL